MRRTLAKVTVAIQCDLARCAGPDGPLIQDMVRENEATAIADLTSAGWIVGRIDACPSCARELEEENRPFAMASPPRDAT